MAPAPRPAAAGWLPRHCSEAARTAAAQLAAAKAAMARGLVIAR